MVLLSYYLPTHPLILKLKYCQIRMGWTEEMDIEGTRSLFERSVREVKRAKAIFMMYFLGQTTVRISLKPLMLKSWRKNDVKPYYFRLSWYGDMSHSYVSSTSRCSVVFARRSLFLFLNLLKTFPCPVWHRPRPQCFLSHLHSAGHPSQVLKCDIKRAPTKCAQTIF